MAGESALLRSCPPPATTPDGALCVHVVEPGESLALIADLYQLAPGRLVVLNDLADPDALVVGQVVVLGRVQDRPIADEPVTDPPLPDSVPDAGVTTTSAGIAVFVSKGDGRSLDRVVLLGLAIVVFLALAVGALALWRRRRRRRAAVEQSAEAPGEGPVAAADPPDLFRGSVDAPEVRAPVPPDASVPSSTTPDLGPWANRHPLAGSLSSLHVAAVHAELRPEGLVMLDGVVYPARLARDEFVQRSAVGTYVQVVLADPSALLLIARSSSVKPHNQELTT